ncbi:ABC transporter permease [Streptomyces sp. JH34]|uniref:ABC transporter permease n=1 Tax=Streptomyces sp. JH34 TaxID=2793633 RepID=UPI0023F7245B|nr:ABC transporter permease [Streptomyces sp. JH34]MDF6019762.1 ABC transporter permease [Streptomyces sp. JH34]
MSTLTPTRPSLRGPVRVLLRQHRRALWAALALMLLGMGFVVALRVWIAVSSSEELCADGDVTPCGDAVYLSTYARTSTEVFLADGGSAMLLLAALVGVFVAGPLIARELESGTFRFAWAQSVRPARWLAARLATPMALATAGTVVLMLVYRWGRSAVDQFPLAFGLDWYAKGVYPALGPVALGYTVLAVALGALCAMVVRRTLVAVSATLLLFGLVALAMGKLRYRLWPSVRLTGDAHPQGSIWHLDSGMLTASGQEVGREDCLTMDGFTDHVACMRARGGVTPFIDYHPASHFWPLQLVETGILLALAAVAVIVAFRVLRRRTV